MGRIVTHIVPYFAPTIDGVGDYALNLARRLRDSHGWNSRFLVGDSDWSGPDRIEDFSVVKAPNHRLLAGGLDGVQTSLLHYVGYGYQKRGVPVWLAKGILPNAARRRTVTVFHEIWSKGPPWKSVFYLSRLQKRLVRNFLEISARAFVSTRESFGKLQEIKSGVAAWLPIPSNLAVPEKLGSPARDGEKWVILVFGQTGPRSRAIQLHANLLTELNRRGLIREVLVAGKEATPASPEVTFLSEIIPKDRIRVEGEVNANENDLFAAADVYLSSHWASNSCKSGALMAALAAGCPTLACDFSDPTPLRADQEILTCDGSITAVDELIAKKRKGLFGQVGARGREWYLQNADWPIVSAKIAAALADR